MLWLDRNKCFIEAWNLNISYSEHTFKYLWLYYSLGKKIVMIWMIQVWIFIRIEIIFENFNTENQFYYKYCLNKNLK